MAEFVQTMKDWRRMCKAQERIEKTDPCRVCPLANNCNDCCGIYEDNEGDDTRDYVRIEGVVARWAKENHEPVYPTWEEWLSDKYNLAYNDDFRLAMSREPIPADIAEKLGIEPKEG